MLIHAKKRTMAAKRGARLLTDIAKEIGARPNDLRYAAHHMLIKYDRMGTCMTVKNEDVPACIKLCLERGWIK